MTPAQGQRHSDLEALTDVCNVIPDQGRTLLMQHALNVIECMGSLGRAATLEHAQLMIDESLRGIRRLCEVVAQLEQHSAASSAAIAAAEAAHA
jgi:hypothetical protein